jgi:uncharacterized protein
MTEIEKRGHIGVETRAEDGKRTLKGYAALFNSDTTIGDYFVERIAPGAFDSALTADVRALVDHDSGRVIGRTKSGTLRMSVDSKGLAVEIDIPDTRDGNDLWVLVERGDISGMSFGFRVTRQEWDESGDMPVRTILDLDLFEVSAVAFPAYEDTSLAKRSLESARQEREAIDKDAEKRAADAAAARRRIALRAAKHNQTIRGIRQDAP